MNATVNNVPNLKEVAQIGERLVPMLNTLRETEPIVWNETVGGWMIMRHEDVVAAYMGRVPLSSRVLNVRAFGVIPEDELARRIPTILRAVPHWIVNMDPPEHSRVRALMMQGFKRKTIEALRPAVRQLIAGLLDGVESQAEFEIIHDVLREITVRTIMNLIGVPTALLPEMQRWSDHITAAFVTSVPTAKMLDNAEGAFSEMQVVMIEQIRRRRTRPSEDFLSQLVHARDAGQQLTDEEIISQMFLLLTAGHESTTNTMALGLVMLLRHRDRWAPFLESPERNSESVSELMRHVAMSAVSYRVATQDFNWHGKSIRQGDLLLLMIASANRDPRAFDSPEDLLVERRNDKSLVFGHGAHHCIGHLLARMEISEFLPAILRRFPGMTLRDTALTFGGGLSFRGLETLWIRTNK